MRSSPSGDTLGAYGEPGSHFPSIWVDTWTACGTRNGMPTPRYDLRVPLADQRNIEQVAKIIGAKSGRAFAAHALGAICSGDENRIREFMENFFRGLSGQMTLNLMQAHSWQPRKRPAKAIRGRKGGAPP